MAEKQSTHESYDSADWADGCSQEPQAPGQGLDLLHPSSVQGASPGLPKAAAAGAELLLLSQLAGLGAEGAALPSSTQLKADKHTPTHLLQPQLEC